MNYPYNYTTLSLDGASTCDSESNIGVKINGSQNFTIDAWVNTTEMFTLKSIVKQEGVFDFGIDKNKLYISIKGYPAIKSSITKGIIESGKWCHVCAVFNNSNIILYINGYQNIFSAVAGNGNFNENKFIFGDNFCGLIRQVRIFKSALERDDILEYMMKTDLDEKFKNILSVCYSFSQIPHAELIQNKTIALRENAKMCFYASGGIFSGNSFVSIDNEPDINPAGKGNDSFTVQTWIFLQPADFSKKYTIFANGDILGDAGMSLYIEEKDGSHKVGLLRGNDTLTSASNIHPCTWINIAATYSIDTLKIYINGILDNSLTGMFPIPVELSKPTLLMGAEVVENNNNGQDWFSGCISRLDIWNCEFSVDDIIKYATQIPDISTNGLQASYSFQINEMSNSVNSNIVNKHNGFEFGQITYDIIETEKLYSKTPLDEDDSIYIEPLPEEVLQTLRKSVLSEGRVGQFKHIYKDICSSTGSKAEDLDFNIFFTVTAYKQGEAIYFVAHDKDESYTMCYTHDNNVFDDEMVIWWIELFLILLGGLITIVCGLKIKSNTVLVGAIKNLIASPQITTLFASQILTIEIIINFVKTAFKLGLLTGLLKAALHDFSFWKVLWAIGCFTALAIASAFGGWVYYAVAIGILIAELVIHLTKKPRRIPSLNLSAIQLNCSNASINIKRNQRLISPPEWNSLSTENTSYVAYKPIKFLNSEHAYNASVRIRASFRSSDISVFKVIIYCKDNGSVYGQSNSIEVTMSAGTSIPQYVDFSFPNNRIGARGISRDNVSLNWFYSYDLGVTWIPMATTQHIVYTILSEPKAPWTTDTEGGNLNLSFPWVEALDYACAWATGQTTAEGAATKITQVINSDLSLKYHNLGAPSYTETNEISQKGHFELNKFLNYLRKRNSDGRLVNCVDCATIVATFANLVGCHLTEKRITTSRSTEELKFLCNKVIIIGDSTSPLWKKPFGNGFAFHEICTAETGGNVNFLKHKIYDACLKVDGRSRPYRDEDADNVRIPTLPVGMQFSKYNSENLEDILDEFMQGNEYDVSSDSYREHLTPVNDKRGAYICLPFYDFNSTPEFIYKSVR